MNFNRQKLATKLANELRTAREDAERFANADRENTLANLKPGETVPGNVGTLLDKGIRDMAEQSIYAHRTAMLEAIDAEIENLNAAMAEAPSTDAAAYVAVIASRDDLTQGEYESAMAAYGTNHAAAKAIKAAAHRSGLYVSAYSPLEEYRAALAQAREMVIKNVTLFGIMGMSEGRAEFTAQTLAGIVLGETDGDGANVAFMSKLFGGHRVV